MQHLSLPESCPICHSESSVIPKLVLIDEGWVPTPGKDPRLKYFADLRVDDLKPEYIKEEPLQQFIEGYFCNKCGKGFVSESILHAAPRSYK